MWSQSLRSLWLGWVRGPFIFGWLKGPSRYESDPPSLSNSIYILYPTTEQLYIFANILVNCIIYKHNLIKISDAIQCQYDISLLAFFINTGLRSVSGGLVLKRHLRRKGAFWEGYWIKVHAQTDRILLLYKIIQY